MKQSTLTAMIIAILTNMMIAFALMLVLPRALWEPTMYVVTACIAAGFAGFAYLSTKE